MEDCWSDDGDVSIGHFSDPGHAVPMDFDLETYLQDSGDLPAEWLDDLPTVKSLMRPNLSLIHYLDPLPPLQEAAPAPSKPVSNQTSAFLHLSFLHDPDLIPNKPPQKVVPIPLSKQDYERKKRAARERKAALLQEQKEKVNEEGPILGLTEDDMDKMASWPPRTVRPPQHNAPTSQTFDLLQKKGPPPAGKFSTFSASGKNFFRMESLGTTCQNLAARGCRELGSPSPPPICAAY